ncbi:hypothetical protein GCM10009624_02260 [Gordonia sinesedis]
MRLNVRSTDHRRATRFGAVAALAGASAAAASVLAAPAGAAPADQVRTINVSQTPAVGVNLANATPTGGFVAPLAAAATEPGVTRVWLEPIPGNACATGLRATRVGLTWKNTTTGRTGDEVFASCTAGKPTVSPALRTGSGRVEIVTTILGRGNQTFSVAPGNATIIR